MTGRSFTDPIELGSLSPQPGTGGSVTSISYTLDINDVIALFSNVAGAAGAPVPQYLFVDAAADLSGITTSSAPPPALPAVAAMSGDLSLAFTAILTGDLAGHV